MVPHYHINVFWSEEDGNWVAEVPDLPGCSAHGRTPTEAAREAEDAMALWLDTAADEGLPIPPMRYRPGKAEAA